MKRAHPAGRLWGPVLAMLLATTSVAEAQKKDAFSRRDTNSDGVITLQEWTASGEKAVRRLDSNGDGSISRQEFQAFQKRRAARIANRLFRRVERRGGKHLELSKIRREKRRNRLQKMDLNRDGKLTRQEAEAALMQRSNRRMERLFRRFDKDGDGKITLAERAAMNDRRFTRLDADRDGRLTRAELTEARKRFRTRKLNRRGDAGNGNAGSAVSGPKKPESYRKQ